MSQFEIASDKQRGISEFVKMEVELEKRLNEIKQMRRLLERTPESMYKDQGLSFASIIDFLWRNFIR